MASKLAAVLLETIKLTEKLLADLPAGGDDADQLRLAASRHTAEIEHWMEQPPTENERGRLIREVLLIHGAASRLSKKGRA
jgi:hypothetical protein